MKKNAALLHFLAFLLLDHNFGVLRGERLARRKIKIDSLCLTGPAYLAAGPFLTASPRYAYSFVTKRVPEKSRYFRGAGHGLGAARP